MLRGACAWVCLRLYKQHSVAEWQGGRQTTIHPVAGWIYSVLRISPFGTCFPSSTPYPMMMHSFLYLDNARADCLTGADTAN